MFYWVILVLKEIVSDSVLRLNINIYQIYKQMQGIFIS